MIRQQAGLYPKLPLNGDRSLPLIVSDLMEQLKGMAITEIVLLLLYLLGKPLLQKQSSRVVKVDFQTRIILRIKPKDILKVNLKLFIFIRQMF